MNNKSGIQTDIRAATGAYATDGRSQEHESTPVISGWHGAFDRLLGRGYIFMGHTFATSGVLFRGMPADVLQSLQDNTFWHSHDEDPLCRLERDLNVIFCSETARDALAVAKPWQGARQDAAILVFDSAVFNRRWQDRTAAVLGFADVGMVFKYPCLAEPLVLADLYGVLLHPETLARYEADGSSLMHDARPYCVAPAPEELASREGWAAALERLLARGGVEATQSLSTADYPRR